MTNCNRIISHPCSLGQGILLDVELNIHFPQICFANKTIVRLKRTVLEPLGPKCLDSPSMIPSTACSNPGSHKETILVKTSRIDTTMVERERAALHKNVYLHIQVEEHLCSSSAQDQTT